MREKWTPERIPDQSGRVAIVTGANTGIGYETARRLAGKGAHVVLACRTEEKAWKAIERIKAEEPRARCEFGHLDLSDLSSVEGFARGFTSRQGRLDLLINNAGVMAPPSRQETSDGFELQFGVNHLAHFALTRHLWDRLTATPGSRVVSVASAAHRFGQMDFEDPNWQQRPYRKWSAYGQSKLANLLFMRELDRRLNDSSVDVIATAGHPGWTATDLQRHVLSARLFQPFFAMPTAQGALPTLRAAVDPKAAGGEYFGPDGWSQMRGYPVPVGTSARARSDDDAARLWQLSEELTGVRFDFD